MINRDLRDILAGVLMSAIGLFFALYSKEYTFGTAARMGPGYMPTVLGWSLFIVGIIIFLPACFRRGDKLVIVWDSLLASVVSLVVFAFTLELLGVFLSTVLTVIVASLPKKIAWLNRGILAVSIATITCLIFVWGLKMTLPLFPEFLYS